MLNFSNDIDTHELRTYSVTHPTHNKIRENEMEEISNYRAIDVLKSKLLASKADTNANRNSVNSAQDVNSISSADEWVDLEEDDIDSENENSSRHRLSTAAPKSAINPLQLVRGQNFIR